MLENIRTTLEAQWPAVASAPTLVLVLMAVAMVVAWILRGSLSRGRIGALEDQLRLVADRFDIAAGEKADLEKAIGRLERGVFEVADAKDRITLTGMSAAVRSHASKFHDLWGQVGTSIGTTRGLMYGNPPPKDQKKK